MFSPIDERVADIQSGGLIDPKVALGTEILEQEDDGIKSNVLITFKDYSSNQCEIEHLGKVDVKKLTKTLRELSTTKHDQLHRTRLVKDSVPRANNYLFLYNDLADDIELKEIEFSGPGRIFGYFVENNKFFCIVSIRARHIKK